MKLYEFEGKQLLADSGIAVPRGRVVSTVHEFEKAFDELNCVAVKGQALSGKRGKAGAVCLCDTKEGAVDSFRKIYGMTHQGETVEKVLVEEAIRIENEFYACITYDTAYRAPVLVVSGQGGVDIEAFKREHPEKVVAMPIDANHGLMAWQAREALAKAGLEGRRILKLAEMLEKMWACFKRFDCRVLEINPLVETEDGDVYACDAKVVLDDDALFRHRDLAFEPRSPGRKQTEKEREAKKIDENDHRGTAGQTYVDLDGDIAVLASGGGASIVIMDALLAYGGKPANFTEYSGNPPAEKVEKLTRLVLDKPGLAGCWVVGGTANFTDIYETLRGFLNGLRSIEPKPDYPIVVRRGGPRDEEAFAMLREAAEKEGWDFHVYGRDTSMTSTAETMVELSNAYKKRKGAGK